MSTKDLSFEGKRVLVTGGGRGLGYEIVKKFYEKGATVFALDNVQSLLDDLKSQFPNVNTICVDLRNWEETRKTVESIAPIDHLVNNAGVSMISEFAEIQPEQLDLVLDVNLKAVIVVSQAVAKGIIDRSTGGGTIVNVSSVGDRVAVKGFAIYSCTKAAVTMLTKSMALELGVHNIRVNCILPSAMATPMFAELNTDSNQPILDRQIVKRLLEPSEAADLVIFLSSPLSAMLTGADIPIDGGFSAC